MRNRNRPPSNKPKSPYQMAGTGHSADNLFAELVAILGYPIGKAYSIAYPDSNAKANSITPMASRLIRDSGIQSYIFRLWRQHSNGTLTTFNEQAIKE